jgi:RNA polymerase sigma-70 factor (ECF subfamily)
VTATREAIRIKKRAQKFTDPELESLESRATDDDPELSYMKALYREAFRTAFRAAVLTLDPREKKALHQHTVLGLTIDEIGAAHGVHRATAARWVQGARESLFAAVRRELAENLQVNQKELASVLRLVQSHLEVTMKRLLG